MLATNPRDASKSADTEQLDALEMIPHIKSYEHWADDAHSFQIERLELASELYAAWHEEQQLLEKKAEKSRKRKKMRVEIDPNAQKELDKQLKNVGVLSLCNEIVRQLMLYGVVGVFVDSGVVYFGDLEIVSDFSAFDTDPIPGALYVRIHNEWIPDTDPVIAMVWIEPRVRHRCLWSTPLFCQYLQYISIPTRTAAQYAWETLVLGNSPFLVVNRQPVSLSTGGTADKIPSTNSLQPSNRRILGSLSPIRASLIAQTTDFMTGDVANGKVERKLADIADRTVFIDDERVTVQHVPPRHGPSFSRGWRIARDAEEPRCTLSGLLRETFLQVALVMLKQVLNARDAGRGRTE